MLGIWGVSEAQGCATCVSLGRLLHRLGVHGRHGPGALARVPPAQTVRTATQRKAQRDIHHALSYAIVAIASSGRKLRIHHLSEVTWTVLRSTREDRKVRHQAALASFVTQTNVCVMRLVAPILAGNWGYPQPPDPRSSACCALRLQNPVRP